MVFPFPLLATPHTVVLREEVAAPASGALPGNPGAAAYLLPLLVGLPFDKALISSIRCQGASAIRIDLGPMI